jgi:spore coat polysaccharide biosynthesis protein SpsF
MKTVAIIQARLGSTRLPAKVLLPLPTGRVVLQEVIHRCQQIQGIDAVVVAIPATADNDLLLPFASAAAMVVRGPEHDVLARYWEAAKAAEADVIMRITADCPLLDPQTCTETLDLYRKHGPGYVSNAWPVREYPHGWDCEVFSREALELAHFNATDYEDREHVTPYMKRTQCKAFLKARVDRSHLRWTLDALDDYVRIVDVFNRPNHWQREAA